MRGTQRLIQKYKKQLVDCQKVLQYVMANANNKAASSAQKASSGHK